MTVGVPATCQGSETLADESKDAASERPTVNIIVINAIPNFIDIILSAYRFTSRVLQSRDAPAVWTFFTLYRQREVYFLTSESEQRKGLFVKPIVVWVSTRHFRSVLIAL